MAEAKTKPTMVSVHDFIATVADAERQRDCEALGCVDIHFIAALLLKIPSGKARFDAKAGALAR